MGSGISLNKQQIIFIIKREMEKEFYEKQYGKPLYYDGYIIHETFDDEEFYLKKLRELEIYNINNI